MKQSSELFTDNYKPANTEEFTVNKHLKRNLGEKNGEYNGLVTLTDGSAEHGTVSFAESIYGTKLL